MRRSPMLLSTGSRFSIAAIVLSCLEPAIAADWPQWRGPDRNGVSQETGLLKEWPKEGPPIAWEAKGLGTGYASVAIADGRIVTLGDRKDATGKKLCHVVCLDKSGKELWATPIGKDWGDGGPRSTPTVDGDLVYAVTPHGDLACLEVSAGAVRWQKNMQNDFKGRMMSGWGYCESVLIDGDRLICTPGGDDAAVVALDKKSGNLVWKATVPKCGGAGYASPVMARVGDVKQYVTLFGKSGGAVAVRASDGKLMWRHNKVAGGTANVPTPVVRGNLVFYSTGYGDGGSAVLKMSARGGAVHADEVYLKTANQLRNHHGGVVLVGDYLYGGHGQNDGLPFCIEFATGKEMWKRARGPGDGSAAVIYADGHLYFRYENGTLALIEAKPNAVTVKGKFKIAGGKTPSWPHPAISDGQLFIRDQDRLVVYDVRAR